MNVEDAYEFSKNQYGATKLPSISSPGEGDAYQTGNGMTFEDWNNDGFKDIAWRTNPSTGQLEVNFGTSSRDGAFVNSWLPYQKDMKSLPPPPRKGPE